MPYGSHRVYDIGSGKLKGRSNCGITNSDKETDSRYNLYKYAGLPPTPIANPGLASIEAALQPAQTDYYYYALGKDGQHRFFTNYNDHVNFLNSGEYIGN